MIFMDFGASAIGFIAKRISNGAGRRAKKTPLPALPDGVFDKVSEAKSEFFTMGFGKAQTMPDEPIPGKKKYYVAGYRAFNPAIGVLDPMMAKAVWIDDNSGKGGVVFCAVDCVGLFKYDVDRVKAELADFVKETGCRCMNICSTHNHAGIDTMGMWGPIPRSGRTEAFMRKVYDGIKTAVKDAYADRREGSLYLGYGKADEGMQRDDRKPQVFSDALTRLRFVPNDGTREIYFVNFASHSESLEGKNSLVSADFPAYIAEEVMRQKGAELCYFVGAIGGLVRMWPLDEDNVISTKKTGKRLGEILCDIKEEEEVKLSPKISFIKQEFYVEAENPVLISAAKIKLIPTIPYDLGSGALNVGLRTEITYMEIGSLKMVFLPGELFPELAYGGYLSAEESADGLDPSINPKTLCEIVDDDKLLVFGLSNDEIGYIPTPNDFHLHPEKPYLDKHDDRLGRRHYEETNSLGPNTAYFVVNTFQKMIDIVNATK